MKHLFNYLFLIGIIIACSNESNEENRLENSNNNNTVPIQSLENSLSRNWKLLHFTHSGLIVLPKEKRTIEETKINKALSRSFLNFRNDHTYQMSDNGKMVRKGRWELSSDHKKIIQHTEEKKRVIYQIVSFKNDTLKLEEPTNGHMTLYYTFIPNNN